MSLIGVLIAVFLACVVIWGVRALITAFAIPQPWATVLHVLAVVLVVLIVLSRLGVSLGF